jgi:hypothetical protein
MKWKKLSKRYKKATVDDDVPEDLLKIMTQLFNNRYKTEE